MIIEIKVPSAGESITRVELARWMVENGSHVEKDQEIAEIDSDKATLTINAQQAGKIIITVQEGTTVKPGDVIGSIDSDGVPEQQPTTSAPASAAPQEGKTPERELAAAAPEQQTQTEQDLTFSPQAKKLIDELNLPVQEIIKNPENRRITKQDLLSALARKMHKDLAPFQDNGPAATAVNNSWEGKRSLERQKMSTLRRKISERLVAVKNQTAMLTTFNEVDMSGLIDLRKKYQGRFTEKYGIKLGFMAFFVKAVTESIPFFPAVNAYLEDDHIVIPSYADVGIAVSTPKGLMVPVIRDAQAMGIAELENQISLLAAKARDNKITIDDLTGGTFSVTNGGVFGSMLSTPILNPPQSAILGMHNIVERPVAINGKVEIRPVMYLALSYDHRVIDGKESVGFLYKIKELIENPERMLLQGKETGEALLGLD